MNDPYCSQVCREAGEAQAGTADTVDVWLMLEYRGTWGPQVVTDNALDAAFRAWFEGYAETFRAQGKRVRPQFIKQQTSGELRLFTMEGERILQRAALDYDGFTRAADTQIADHLYFVCTHGQRDRCCSEFGMPVYRALRERLGDRVFQTSHLGGHRYAPNVLVAPNAVMYGRVSPDDLDGFLARTESGLMALEFARGRTCYEPAVQAAEILAAEHSSLIESRAESESRWAVVFEQRTVQLVGQPTLGVASCGDVKQKAGIAFSLAS